MSIDMGPKKYLSAKNRKNERGAALFTSIFGLFLTTILASSLYMVSDGARKTSVNYSENSEAFYIAEAGMAHATGLFVTNGQTYNISTDIPGSGVAFGAGNYKVTAVNGSVANTIKVTSIGTGSNGSTATLEETLSFATSNVSDAAIVINGSAQINANILVLGTQGVIHANGTMSLSGNMRAQKYYSATSTISGSFTQPCPNGPHTGASGCDATTDVRQNQTAMAVPDVKPTDLFASADYRFYPTTTVGGVTTNAYITNKLGVVVASGCNSGCYGGWTWNASQGWVANGSSTLPAGTLYAVQSSFTINKNFGSSGAPQSVTFVADGAVSFSGGASYMTAAASFGGRKFAVVAGADVSIQGANLYSTNSEASFYARHQFNFAGGQPKLNGNILVYNEADTALYGSNIVARSGNNSFITSGDPQVTFNGNGGSGSAAGAVTISSWREVRN